MNCQESNKSGLEVTCYVTLFFLCLLLIFELLQFLSKIKEGELNEYFGMQNSTELTMFMLAIALFVTQWNDNEMNSKKRESWEDQDREENHHLQKHLLGWTLFLAWMDLTIFLGKMDFFGRHIYMSWQIMRSMFLNLAVLS